MKKWGWKVYYVPQAEMVHHHQRQSAQGFMNKTLAYHITSMFHFYAKWGTFIGFLKKYRVLLGIMLFPDAWIWQQSMHLFMLPITSGIMSCHFLKNPISRFSITINSYCL